MDLKLSGGLASEAERTTVDAACRGPWDSA